MMYFQPESARELCLRPTLTATGVPRVVWWARSVARRVVWCWGKTVKKMNLTRYNKYIKEPPWAPCFWRARPNNCVILVWTDWFSWVHIRVYVFHVSFFWHSLYIAIFSQWVLIVYLIWWLMGTYKPTRPQTSNAVSRVSNYAQLSLVDYFE